MVVYKHTETIEYVKNYPTYGMGWDGMGWDGMGWDGIDGWMDGRKDGRTERWMSGWMDRWMYGERRF